MKFTAHNYQIDAAAFLGGNPFSALFADPGTGKTAIVLMLLTALKKAAALERPVLITGPLRIAHEVWPAEIKKWGQFNHFTYEILHGPHKAHRVKNRAVDLHIINNEGLQWLAKTGNLTKYKTLIVDESSKFKNWMSKRTALLKHCVRMKTFTRRHILTGSPAPRSLLDLFAQMYIADGGASLGPYISHYRQKYFIDKGFGVYHDWQLLPGADNAIYNAIAPRCKRLDASDLLDLPACHTVDIKIDLPDDMIEESLRELTKIAIQDRLVVNASTEYQNARRIAGGILETGPLHTAKIDVLRDLIDELQGNPALVFFYYRAEGEYLAKMFRAPIIYGGTSVTDTARICKKWNAGDLPVLLAQPAAAGHGLNLQAGGKDVIWYSFTDNQDDYYQGIRRVWRQGVGGRVTVHRLIARRSVDVAMIRALESKTIRQADLLDAIRDLVR